MKLLTVGLLGLFIFTNCRSNFQEIPMNNFIGTWDLKGRKMFEGIRIQITENKGIYSGTIVQLNDNKYIKMFADTADVWISNIERTSNYQFKLSERKIARELFSIYGLSTSQEYRAEFSDENKIIIAKDGNDIKKSEIYYERVQ